ncbi:phosphoenolpyruvate carboxykinase [bacterium]|nr:phosphoenolpyruvate carboxykinase [bacterium]MBU1065187.1 phosphoenolpyruvate carboxykinase [bacterium]MBU1635171.1 phosphoenolpyruvate carboxykinase [bacterium]MBU1872692.1 phosphoenolpyruvate carboxykinase [bacterium]
MSKFPSKIIEKKIIIGVKDRIAESVEELFESDLFKEILKKFLDRLIHKQSPVLAVFGKETITDADRMLLYKTLYYLTKLDASLVPGVVKGSEMFFRDTELLNELVEQLYNYWRSFDRFIICDSEGESYDKRPFRTFNTTVERLMHLVLQAYRDVHENITSRHPRVYRQVHAGAEVATIAIPLQRKFFNKKYDVLKDISIIRQILLYPPLILKPPMNKRRGAFLEVDQNPITNVKLDDREWLCFPANVGTLLIHVYFHESFFELGFALANLFQLASDDELDRKPDGIYLYGVERQALKQYGDLPTVYFEDKEENLFIGVVPRDLEFGYFGYLKKMILTLHNLIVMKRGNMPFHGALVQILLKNNKQANVLLIGDSGAGKSESLEAFRKLGDEEIKDLTIIADDMGSISVGDKGNIVAYGTEIGAFLRLDDLHPGYAFGQIDRAIIMSAGQTNARIVLPVTTQDNITKGVAVDYIFYANNYENIDAQHPIIERFDSAETAFNLFREGNVMSKGTTTTTGLVQSYFANIFGPVQRKELHDEIARRFFQQFFENGIYVGQIRTRLGVSGFETDGPREAAEALLKLIMS